MNLCHPFLQISPGELPLSCQERNKTQFRVSNQRPDAYANLWKMQSVAGSPGRGAPQGYSCTTSTTSTLPTASPAHRQPDTGLTSPAMGFPGIAEQAGVSSALVFTPPCCAEAAKLFSSSVLVHLNYL